MVAIARAILFDAHKTLSNRMVWIVGLIVLITQPLFALVEATQIASIGVTATPQTNPELLEPLPPVALMGFDVMPFGEAVVIVLGALLGASEYNSRELRTAFLAVGSRRVVLIGKIVATCGLAVVLSALANWLTLVFTHLGLGSQGLSPLILAGETWVLLVRAVLTWSAFLLISWSIAMVTKSWVVAMLLMVPQAVGLGDLLATLWLPGRYLPVAAGHCLTAVPTGTCTWQPSAVVALPTLTLGLVVLALIVCVRRDVGNR